MNTRSKYLVWFAVLTLEAASLSQIATPDSAGGVTTFKAETRLVLLDVVVTNGKGDPVPGLHQQDFQVTENGRLQTVSFFEEHTGQPSPAAKLPPMPPNVFTNYPLSKTPDTVNVLLLDWLNTQPQDQAYVREQTIQYLKNAPPGTPLAVFTLGASLHLVQAFTTDPSVLLEALEKKKVGPDTESTRLLSTAVREAAEQDLVNLMIRNWAAPAAIEAVSQEMATTSALKGDERIRMTLQALQQLARYLSGIPGRKNVIWFSGSFPIAIFPGAGVPQEYQGDLRLTADLLTPDRIAIYPVSAQGLTGNFTYEAEYLPSPREQRRNLREDNLTTGANRTAMEELAKDTGGQAFYNTNSLSDAMAHAIDSGSHYYGLAYVPTDKNADGKYRAIQVKLLNSAYKLSYRRGYYAEEPKTLPDRRRQKPTDPLLALMAFGRPDSTQVVYKVRVLPSSPQPAADASRAGSNTDLQGSVMRYSVEYAVEIDDLALRTTADGVRHGKVEAMVVAYDLNGKPLNFVVRKFGIELPRTVYEAVKKVGLQLVEDIDVPARDVYVRTGIYDLSSARAGTLLVPLSYTPHTTESTR